MATVKRRNGVIGTNGDGGGGNVNTPMTEDLDVDTFLIKSTTSSVVLDATDTPGAGIVVMPDATGVFSVLFELGTPGIDEVTIDHDGTAGNIRSLSGALTLGSPSSITHPVNGVDKLLIQSTLIRLGNGIATLRPLNNNQTTLGSQGSRWFEVDVGSHVRYAETTFDPIDLVESAEVVTYHKDNKIIHAFDDAGTVRYKYLDMTGTGTAWVHSTTAP